MDWLSVPWLATYWIPLVIALLLGILLGWLFSRPALNRTRDEYESRLYSAESQARRQSEELAGANRETSRLQQSWEETSSELDQERMRLATAQHDLETAQTQERELASTAEAHESELTARLAELQNTSGQLTETRAAFESATAENMAMKADLEALREAVASRAELSQNTQQTLGEAYSQLAGLRTQLDEVGSALTLAQSNVDNLHKALAD